MSIASDFIRTSFDSTDRLAVVLIHRPSHRVSQRVAEVSSIAAPSFQSWLTVMNIDRGFDVYLSLNSIRPDSKTRTKRDIAAVRHIFLDFDRDADDRVRELLARPDIPKPSALIQSSSGHWQALWPVSGFDPSQAEALQRGLARQTGADIACTDSARIFRLPGFRNLKYSPPWDVSVQYFNHGLSYTPETFPQAAFVLEHQLPLIQSQPAHSPYNGSITQSERDWAYAKRQLALRRPIEEVIAAIANYRTDKPNPEYYARLTATKAAKALQTDPRSQKYLNSQSIGGSRG